MISSPPAWQDWSLVTLCMLTPGHKQQRCMLANSLKDGSCIYSPQQPQLNHSHLHQTHLHQTLLQHFHLQQVHLYWTYLQQTYLLHQTHLQQNLMDSLVGCCACRHISYTKSTLLLQLHGSASRDNGGTQNQPNYMTRADNALKRIFTCLKACGLSAPLLAWNQNNCDLTQPVHVGTCVHKFDDHDASPAGLSFHRTNHLFCDCTCNVPARYMYSKLYTAAARAWMVSAMSRGMPCSNNTECCNAVGKHKGTLATLVPVLLAPPNCLIGDSSPVHRVCGSGAGCCCSKKGYQQPVGLLRAVFGVLIFLFLAIGQEILRDSQSVCGTKTVPVPLQQSMQDHVPV